MRHRRVFRIATCRDRVAAHHRSGNGGSAAGAASSPRRSSRSRYGTPNPESVKGNGRGGHSWRRVAGRRNLISMKLAALVHTSNMVAAASGRLEKTSHLAALLKQATPDEVPIAIGFFIGWPRQGKIGVGWATVADASAGEPAMVPTLELIDVDRTFDALQAVKGKGSAVERARLVRELFARATPDEQRFLSALLIGEVRQGALEGVMLDAVAKAASVPADRLRRAVMLAGDLGVVARAVCAGGEAALTALADYRIELFRPVQPMLADSAADVEEALGMVGEATVEWKLDGAR